MSNYSPIVNFAAKDALLTGDPSKKILGTEMTAELTAIATMSTSKEDTANKGIAGGYVPLSGAVKILDTYLSSNVPLLTSANTWTAQQVLSAAAPNIEFNETDAAANNQRWSLDVNSEIMRFRLRNDADNTNTSFMIVNRTLNVCDSVEFITTNFLHTGDVELTANLNLGHPTDTTLSRASAGVLAVEGHQVPTKDQTATISAVWNFTSTPQIAGVDIVAIPLVASTYTPTLTNGANVAASTANVCMYLRVGNTVTVHGSVQVDPTSASTLTTIEVSLPIASALTTIDQIGGVGADQNGSAPYAIYCNFTNDRAILTTGSIVGTTNRTVSFTFGYQLV
jgi:hypothetical protein